MQYKKSYIYPSLFSLWDKYVRIHCLLNNIKLRNQEVLVFTYFCIDGIRDETYQFMIANNVVKEKQIIDNAKCSLVKKGLIKKVGSTKWEVIEPFKSAKIDDTLILMIQCLKKKS